MSQNHPGQIVLSLEGGYNCDVTAECGAACVSALLREEQGQEVQLEVCGWVAGWLAGWVGECGCGCGAQMHAALGSYITIVTALE